MLQNIGVCKNNISQFLFIGSHSTHKFRKLTCTLSKGISHQMALHSPHVLVTGGTGFVATHLIEQLITVRDDKTSNLYHNVICAYTDLYRLDLK
jgi:hypothetical protein